MWVFRAKCCVSVCAPFLPSLQSAIQKISCIDSVSYRGLVLEANQCLTCLAQGLPSFSMPYLNFSCCNICCNVIKFEGKKYNQNQDPLKNNLAKLPQKADNIWNIGADRCKGWFNHLDSQSFTILINPCSLMIQAAESQGRRINTTSTEGFVVVVDEKAKRLKMRVCLHKYMATMTH